MMRCVALESQKSLRDLAQLPRLVEEVVWLGMDELTSASEPAVICGIFLSEDEVSAANLIRTRSQKGFATILTPRFKASDLAPLLGAPAGIELKPADFDTVHWEDGAHYSVSGVCHLQTALHAGRWATATGLGPVVLAYRPRSAAGPIVICTALVAGRPLGVDRNEQRRLLQRILAVTESVLPTRAQIDEKSEGSPAAAPDLDTYLRETGEHGAALLLTILACNGDRESDLADAAGKVLGLQLNLEEIEQNLKRIPQASVADISSSLKQHGWTAYLRRVEQFLREREES
jgi:hypothetical protein